MLEKSIVLSFILAVNLVAAVKHKSKMVEPLTNYGNELFVESVNIKPGNVFLSLYSVKEVLEMLSFGASCESFDEFQHVLGLSDKNTNAVRIRGQLAPNVETYGVTLNLANKIYMKNGCTLKEAFQDVVENNFRSEVEKLDVCDAHDAAKLINAYVSEKTKKTITNVVRANEIANIGMALVNTVYFKGRWELFFDRASNTKEKFYNDVQDSTFMNQQSQFDFAVVSDLDARAVRMKFSESNMYFLIILPNKQNGLPNLREKLKNFDLTKDLNFKPENVMLSVPKFKFAYSVDMNKVLKRTGLKNVFEKPDFQDLFESCNNHNVAVVFHKTEIDFTEAGCSVPHRSTIPVDYPSSSTVHEFKANYPFFFAIGELDPRVKKKHRIIFSGQYLGLYPGLNDESFDFLLINEEPQAEEENLANENPFAYISGNMNYGTINQAPQAEDENQESEDPVCVKCVIL